MAKGQVVALVGGQYGSEGKGSIAHYLADEFNVHVRSGGPNAGHTFYHDGLRWPMQQIPCGWTNSNATLLLTAGALVSLEVLERELKAIGDYEGRLPVVSRRHITNRLIVDSSAGIITEDMRKVAGGTEGEAHKRYGSTGEGVGVARMARLTRDTSLYVTARQAAERPDHRWLEQLLMDHTQRPLNRSVDEGGSVLLEGTQGVGLSIVHGTWPYTTNHDTIAAQMAADAGLAPQLITDTIAVLRTYPIRVAGNSGPLRDETTWDDMAQRLGMPGLVELTTVTKKPRRIGGWDWELAEWACMLNRPSGLALTFLDYIDPGCRDIATWNELTKQSSKAARFVCDVEDRLGVPVWFVGTGPDQLIDRRPNKTKPEHWPLETWSKHAGLPSGSGLTAKHRMS